MVTLPPDSTIIAMARGIYPALTTIPDVVLEGLLPWCRAMCSLRGFGGQYTLAVSLLLCHSTFTLDPTGTLTPGGGGGVGGSVTSISTISMSASFGGSGVVGAATAMSETDAALATTRWGQQYLMLRRGRSAISAPRAR